MKLTAIVLTCALAGCSQQTVVSGNQPAQTHNAAIPPGETEILSEGAAALSGTAVDIARDQAIDDALRKAVEQGVGAYIDAETRVNNYQLISDNIYSRTHGYVSSYRIIDESRDGDLYRVVIRAVVRTDDIEDDLAAIGILLARQGRPRIMAVIRELSDPDQLEEVSSLMGASMFETAVLDHFREKGFPVVDAATVQEILEKEQLRLILQGDDRTAALLGLEAGAEIIITGTALHREHSRVIGGSLRAVHQYQVSTRAVNTRTGSMLAGSALTVELPFSENQARTRAADSTGIYLESAILDGWLSNENTTVIVATNADFQKVLKLSSDIRNGVRGVTDVVTRDLTGSRATIEIVSETPSSEVLEDMSAIEAGFTVTGFSGNRVEIEFID